MNPSYVLKVSFTNVDDGVVAELLTTSPPNTIKLVGSSVGTNLKVGDCGHRLLLKLPRNDASTTHVVALIVDRHPFILLFKREGNKWMVDLTKEPVSPYLPLFLSDETLEVTIRGNRFSTNSHRTGYYVPDCNLLCMFLASHIDTAVLIHAAVEVKKEEKKINHLESYISCLERKAIERERKLQEMDDVMNKLRQSWYKRFLFLLFRSFN